MRRFLPIILFVLVASCTKKPVEPEVKDEPSFSTEITDPELKVITNEFFRLSKRNNIVFNQKVSLGFSPIDSETVIGTCSYHETFREINLDSNYWKDASWATKIALLYHELTHCYCERDHDFDNGTMYPDGSLRWLIESFRLNQPINMARPEGYLPDKCPKSIMHPVILDEKCFVNHYSYYVKEMFSRCNPY